MPRIHRLRERHQSVGFDFFDWLTDPGYDDPSGDAADIRSCLAKGNAAAAPLEARTAELRANWNPTGFYSPSQLYSILLEIDGLRQDTYKLLEKPAHQSNRDINEAKNQLNAIMTDAQPFIAAYRDAINRNVTQIDAPGLRGFVLKSMKKCSDAVVTATFVGCLEPWWASAIAAFKRLFDAVVDFIMSIPGIVYDAAKTLIKVADVFGTIMRWSLIGGAAFLAWTLFQDRKEK